MNEFMYKQESTKTNGVKPMCEMLKDRKIGWAFVYDDLFT